MSVFCENYIYQGLMVVKFKNGGKNWLKYNMNTQYHRT
jgi:hypothetical protein